MYSADFETGGPQDVKIAPYENRVFLWSLCPLMTGEDYLKDPEGIKFTRIKIGFDIKDFIDELYKINKEIKVYFHNLAFDGAFIVDYLLRRAGYEYQKNQGKNDEEIILEFLRKDKSFGPTHDKAFTALIDSQGKWFYIKLKNGKHYITIKDSIKLLNARVDEIAEAYDMKRLYGVEKTSLDVKKVRAPDWIVTNEDITRVKNDALIMAIALGEHKLNKKSSVYLPKDTASKCAQMSLISKMFNAPYYLAQKDFRPHYPKLEWPDMPYRSVHALLRHGYYGGFCYLNPKHYANILKDVKVLDQNSKYPTEMVNNLFPYGCVCEFEPFGKHVYIVNMENVYFALKEDKIPFIQRSFGGYHGTEMLEFSLDKGEPLVLPQPLFELFIENYEIRIGKMNINEKKLTHSLLNEIREETQDVTDFYFFKAKKGEFDEYINFWYDIKSKNKNVNPVLYMMAKLQLNGFYGKFGQKIEFFHKDIYLDKTTGQIEYVTNPEPDDEYEQLEYLPNAMFTGGYARADIVRKAQTFGDRFVYCDTDSLHLLPDGDVHEDDKELLKHGIQIGDKLGEWKAEAYYNKAKYLHAKCYMGLSKENKEVCVAGYNCHDPEKLPNFEDFYVGAKLQGKISRKLCKGGCMLVENEFTIQNLSKDIYISRLM